MFLWKCGEPFFEVRSKMGKVFIFYYFYIPISEGTSPSEAIEGLLRRWSKRDESLFWADVWGFSQAGSKWLLASVCPSSVRPSVEGPEYRSLKAFWGIGDWETYFRNVGGLGDWKNGGIGDWELGIDRLGIQGLEYWMSMNDCWYGIGRDGRDHKSTTNDYFSNSSPFDIYIYIFIIIIFFFYYSFFFFWVYICYLWLCIFFFFLLWYANVKYQCRQWAGVLQMWAIRTLEPWGFGLPLAPKLWGIGDWGIEDLEYRSLQKGLGDWGIVFFFRTWGQNPEPTTTKKKNNTCIFFFPKKGQFG